MILLSILIPTIPEREEQFKKLQAEMFRQTDEFEKSHWEFIRDHGGIEILSESSKRFLEGGLTIGAKRNLLVQLSQGKYFAFADDDDDIAPNYIETLMRLCALDKDAVSFRCIFKSDTYWTVINMSLQHKRDEQATPERVVKRRLWQVCPMKREIAAKYFFSEKNHNEDGEWLEKVLPNLKSEAHTNKILTQYNHSSQTSEADKIINAGHK